MNSLARMISTFVILIIVTGCGYGHKNFIQHQGRFDEPNSFVIQIDDDGKFWDPAVSVNALEKIREASLRTNTVVLLYIHGWHHNAEIGDENVNDFSGALIEARKTLEGKENDSNIYRESRKILTKIEDINVIAIYVGWRGKSLPMPFDYLTFWGRKTAAERVGDGDQREFMHQLNQIYQQRTEKRARSGDGPFMGMVSFGHSFGGQVLFKAVRPTLEQELVEATLTANRTRKKPISGFGDLVVLVNPAVEALQYEKIHRLSEQIEYDHRQMPLLLVLSSEGDIARQRLFAMGRLLSSLFQSLPASEEERKMLNTALGEYSPQRTHSLKVAKESSARNPSYRELYGPEGVCKLVRMDLTEMVAIGDASLMPIDANRKPHNPYMVAYTSNDIVYQHSGIFREKLLKFFIDYLAINEGKRMVISSNMAKIC
jgi:hypothetical protein